MSSVWKKIVEKSKLFEEIVKACQYILNKDVVAADARAYLDTRLSKDVQAKYQFGFFPQDQDLQQLYSLGIPKKMLEEISLVYPKYIGGAKRTHGHFNNHNLIMPFRDSYGNIISLLGRTLLDDETQKEKAVQKYKYSLNTRKELYVYGLNLSKESIIRKNSVICVEGQFDFIACNEVGISNVAAFGWANISKYQFYSVRKYTDNLILMFDNDEAGNKARKRAKDLYSNHANIKNANIPFEYKDIDECLRKDSNKDDIVKWLGGLGG